MSSFRMGATPITWGIWKEYKRSFAVPGKQIKLPDDPGWGFPDDHPVVNVSWEDIMNPGGFCEWASNVAGFNLTLPTDAQYEYSARGGKDGREFPWGNEFDRSLLWCSERSPSANRVIGGQTGAVKRSIRIYRNGFGLTDMVGNVWQWCADYAHADYRPTAKNPRDNRKSKGHVVRGGSWGFDDPTLFRCAGRDGFESAIRLANVGFRLSAGRK
jgi:sulfatase modifying factor 1